MNNVTKSIEVGFGFGADSIEVIAHFDPRGEGEEIAFAEVVLSSRCNGIQRWHTVRELSGAEALAMFPTLAVKTDAEWQELREEWIKAQEFWDVSYSLDTYLH